MKLCNVQLSTSGWIEVEESFNDMKEFMKSKKKTITTWKRSAEWDGTITTIRITLSKSHIIQIEEHYDRNDD